LSGISLSICKILRGLGGTSDEVEALQRDPYLDTVTIVSGAFFLWISFGTKLEQIGRQCYMWITQGMTGLAGSRERIGSDAGWSLRMRTAKPEGSSARQVL
jgi:hypothetical protein